MYFRIMLKHNGKVEVTKVYGARADNKRESTKEVNAYEMRYELPKEVYEVYMVGVIREGATGFDYCEDIKEFVRSNGLMDMHIVGGVERMILIYPPGWDVD